MLAKPLRLVWSVPAVNQDRLAERMTGWEDPLTLENLEREVYAQTRAWVQPEPRPQIGLPNRVPNPAGAVNPVVPPPTQGAATAAPAAPANPA